MVNDLALSVEQKGFLLSFHSVLAQPTAERLRDHFGDAKHAQRNLLQFQPFASLQLLRRLEKSSALFLDQGALL